MQQKNIADKVSKRDYEQALADAQQKFDAYMTAGMRGAEQTELDRLWSDFTEADEKKQSFLQTWLGGNKS